MKLIFKILTSLILALVLWEIILQATTEKSHGFTNHPVLGRISKPGNYVFSEEGFSRTKINNIGMRGQDIKPKEENEFRIFALGDSYTRGVQVSDDKTYTYLLQKQLENNLKSNVKVINAGIDGASPASYIHIASFYNSSFKPDSVIIQLTDQDFTEDLLNDKKQFYVEKEKDNYKTIYNDEFRSDDPLSRILLQKFPQLGFMLEYSVLRVGGKNLQKSLGTKPNKLNAPPPESSQPSQYDALVDWAVENLKAKYPQLVILYFPDYNNIKGNPSGIETALSRFTTKHNVRFVNMREDFINYYQVHQQRVHGFNNTVPGTGHINEIGHWLTAEHLAVVFEERVLK
jgi:hypothetical protein